MARSPARRRRSPCRRRRSHPNFAYRPETGEEIYHSLLGVPILRAGHVLGILVVQNAKPRSYAEEEVEAIETVAMVLAELVAGGELIGPAESRHAEGATLLPARLTGIVLNEGTAMGLAVPHRREIVVSRIVAEDREVERQRLETALEEMQGALDALLQRSEMARASEGREIPGGLPHVRRGSGLATAHGRGRFTAG